jgi:putative oxidoreductase
LTLEVEKEGWAMDDFALTLLRVTVGMLFVGHGLQKMFGLFGGDGLQRTGDNFAKMRLRDPRAAATGVAFYETFGGLFLALGFATPVACAFILGVMLGAILFVHWPKFWVQEGGFEYPLVSIAIVSMFGLMGPGTWSVDEAIGTAELLVNPWTYLVCAVIVVISVASLAAMREPSHERWQRPSDSGRLASQGR